MPHRTVKWLDPLSSLPLSAGSKGLWHNGKIRPEIGEAAQVQNQCKQGQSGPKQDKLCMKENGITASKISEKMVSAHSFIKILKSSDLKATVFCIH